MGLGNFEIDSATNRTAVEFPTKNQASVDSTSNKINPSGSTSKELHLQQDQAPRSTGTSDSVLNRLAG